MAQSTHSFLCSQCSHSSSESWSAGPGANRGHTQVTSPPSPRVTLFCCSQLFWWHQASLCLVSCLTETIRLLCVHYSSSEELMSFPFQECLINTFVGTCPCFPPLLPDSLQGPFTRISPPQFWGVPVPDESFPLVLCHLWARRGWSFELSGCFISSALPGVLPALSVLPPVFDLVRFPAIYISSHISSSCHLLPYVLLISEM